MDLFPHLKFVQKITGVPRFFGGGSTNETSNENRRNRQQHSNYLSQKTSNLRQEWTNSVSQRREQDLAALDNEIIPYFSALIQI